MVYLVVFGVEMKPLHQLTYGFFVRRVSLRLAIYTAFLCRTVMRIWNTGFGYGTFQDYMRQQYRMGISGFMVDITIVNRAYNGL